MSHAVYPQGPPCNANCPGEWSEYHDGYADGFERVAAARKALVEREQDLRWCGKDDNCHTKAEGVALAIADFDDVIGVAG